MTTAKKKIVVFSLTRLIKLREKLTTAIIKSKTKTVLGKKVLRLRIWMTVMLC